MSALKKSCQYITVFFIKALTLKHFDAEGSTVYSIGQAPRALLAKSWQIFCGAAVRLWLASIYYQNNNNYQSAFFSHSTVFFLKR